MAADRYVTLTQDCHINRRVLRAGRYLVQSGDYARFKNPDPDRPETWTIHEDEIPTLRASGSLKG